MKRYLLCGAVAASLISTPLMAKSVVSDEVLLGLSGLSAALAVVKEGGEGILSDEVLLGISALLAGLAVVVDEEDPVSP
jgi:hypothetical protein